MNVIEALESNFDELTKEGTVLVDFYATWCGPCRMLGPVLEEIASDRSEVKIIKVDVDKNEALARTYGVMSIPTLILFKNGELKDKRTGFAPKEEIMDWIQQ